MNGNSLRLFETAKTAMYLDAVSHKLETRKDRDVKITELTLRIEPFDATLATALSHEVRQELFRMNSPAEPKPILRRVDFALGVPRQMFEVYAAPDTAKASIALDQVKIGGIYARTRKDATGYALTVKASFGPCSREELEFVNEWFLSQKWVTTSEAEPSLDFPVDDEGDEADDDPPGRPALEFDTTPEGEPIEASAGAGATWDQVKHDAEAAVAAAVGNDASPRTSATEPARQRLHSHAHKTAARKPPKDGYPKKTARSLRRTGR